MGPFIYQMFLFIITNSSEEKIKDWTPKMAVHTHIDEQINLKHSTCISLHIIQRMQCMYGHGAEQTRAHYSFAHIYYWNVDLFDYIIFSVFFKFFKYFFTSFHVCIYVWFFISWGTRALLIGILKQQPIYTIYKPIEKIKRAKTCSTSS